uniref:Uncharacterized protein n=1 Tax=Triatoma infestans TaxID=30076 RepID=A0A170U6K0_TRIIF
MLSEFQLDSVEVTLR